MNANSNFHYYSQMKTLAAEKRAEYSIETAKLNLNVIRDIYRKEGVRIDYWPIKSGKIKGLIFRG
jgi:hypothetical protein